MDISYTVLFMWFQYINQYVFLCLIFWKKVVVFFFQEGYIKSIKCDSKYFYIVTKQLYFRPQYDLYSMCLGKMEKKMLLQN